MKTFISLIFLFCFCSITKAGGLMYGNDPIWRSSMTHTTEQNAVITTGAVVMKIKVQMAGNNSYLDVYSNGVLKDHIDTTNNNGDTFQCLYSTPSYSNNGDIPAYVKFYWDWYNFAPTGQDSKGR